MSAHRRTNDVLFHILYGSDTTLIMEVLGASVQRMYEATGSTPLHSAWLRIRSDPDRCIEKARGLLCLLLNLDMPLKEYVCEPNDPCLWRRAFNLPDPKTKQDIEKLATRTTGMHSASLLQCVPLCGKKAALLFKTLRTSTVPGWLHDERMDAAELVRSVRLEYIHC